MFCNKCGKPIENGSKFCQYCGEIQENPKATKKDYNFSEHTNNTIWCGLTVLDIIIEVIYVILLIWWTNLFFKQMKYSWISFAYLGNDARFIGMVLYIVPYALLLCLTVVGIQGVWRHQYHISTGVIISGMGLIMKIGSFFFNEVFYKSFQIIIGRVLNVYGSIGWSTIMLGIIISILLYSKMNSNH